MKKRLLITLISVLFITPSANAAIAIKPMVKLTEVDSAAAGLVVQGDQIMVYGNRDKNGFAQFVNGQTVELNCGVESFVSSATSDSAGNFYLVGASATPIVGTLPPITGVLNPDNVVPDPVSSNKSDPIQLCYWKLDATGKLIDSQTVTMANAVIPYAMLVDKFGITIAGTSYTNPGNNGFVLTVGSAPIYLGKSATSIYAIARSSDGGLTAVGQSSEKLLDKALRGKSDGFLAKFANGKLIAIQRSSDTNATRSWKSATSNLTLGGNSNSTAVITKFANNFTPIWTNRYISDGNLLTATAGKTSYGAFISKGAIKALPAWQYWKRKFALVLTFDSKGSIIAANYLNTPQINGLAASTTLGAIVLANGFLYRA